MKPTNSVLGLFPFGMLMPIAREALMDIIDDRHNQTSTIVASQILVSAWYDIIGEGTIANAILDRIVNSSHRIELRGESLRKGVLKQE